MRLFSTIKSPGLTKVGIASIFRKKGKGRSTTVATQKEHDQEEVVFCVDGDPEGAKTSNNNNIPDPSTACTSPSTNRSKSSNGQSKKSKLRATVDKYQGRIRRFSTRKKKSKKSSPSNSNQVSGRSEGTISKISGTLTQDPKDGLTWSLSSSNSNFNQGTSNTHARESTHDIKSPKKELKGKDSLDSGYSHQGNPDRIFRSIDNKASSNASSSRLLHEFTDKDHCIDCFEKWAAQSSSASTKESHEEECLPKHLVDSIALDRNAWEKIPQYSRIDLSVNKHLGKGAFSDVFEVIVMAETQKALPDGGNKKIDMFDSSTSRRERTNSIDGVTNVGVKKDGRRRRTRSVTFDPKVSASNCNDTEARSVQRTYAMKCLRPFIRSDPEQFIIGVEDLVHETTVLASLDHPNIIKLRGRASGGSGGGFASKSLRPDDRYFILLDRLNDTLEDRIEQWKEDKIASSTSNNGPPSLIQVKTACSIADALSYLHSKNIVFCDLKPANLGFDSKGVLKLFDFGLSTDLNQHPVNLGDTGSSSESDLIRDQRGTLRYMSPEVGLGLGYSFPADVHSFGITLWQICSLQKPFRFVKSPYTFHRKVFEEGERPVISELWPQMLKNIMSRCWSNLPEERPTMDLVNTILHAHAPEYEEQRRNSGISTRGANQLFRKLSETRSF